MTAAPNNVVQLFEGDDAGIFEDGLPCVTPGKYHAIYKRHEGVKVFERWRVRVDMQIVEHPDITLSRWYPVSSVSKQGRIYAASRHSEIVRELSEVFRQRVRTNQVAVSHLRDMLVEVAVDTVTRNYRQRQLTEINQYSSIRQLIKRVLP